MYGNKYGALVDTGAECCLIHKNVYQSLQIKPKLSKSNAILQSVNGGQLKVLGSVSLPVMIGAMKMNHTFIVASGINKNVILGKEWMDKFGVWLYFDLQKLRICKTYAPLQPDLNIHALVRLKDDLVMKPQTSYTCTGKIQDKKEFPPDCYEISQVTEGYVATEPGVLVSNSVVEIKKKEIATSDCKQYYENYTLKEKLYHCKS